MRCLTFLTTQNKEDKGRRNWKYCTNCELIHHRGLGLLWHRTTTTTTTTYHWIWRQGSSLCADNHWGGSERRPVTHNSVLLLLLVHISQGGLQLRRINRQYHLVPSYKKNIHNNQATVCVLLVFTASYLALSWIRYIQVTENLVIWYSCKYYH